MTRDEFLAGARDLVGDGRGMLARVSRLLGVPYRTVRAVSAGLRPVPEEHARRLRQELAAAEQRGGCLSFLAPRLQEAVRAASQAGWSDTEAAAAVASWAALRLANGQ